MPYDILYRENADGTYTALVDEQGQFIPADPTKKPQLICYQVNNDGSVSPLVDEYGQYIPVEAGVEVPDGYRYMYLQEDGRSYGWNDPGAAAKEKKKEKKEVKGILKDSKSVKFEFSVD